jgi:serine/threonine protein kinase/beta-lactam-binding protein with PASTA domain
VTDNQRMIAGRYQLGNLIGRGGMADVYQGVDTRLGRVVAIKLLKSDLANDPNFEARFRQEAQASARMAHPTIVRIYDAGEEEGIDGNGNQIRRPYIVMEFVKGVVLRDLLHQRRLTIDEALEYADGVLSALSTSHNAGIIHRDIKSANIMVTDAGAVKVMDFGIARAVSDSSSTQAHSVGIVGTAQYFSPEQARGENVDARTDLYSTGVLLYEMLAGRPPFKGETAVSVAYQHVSEAVTPPSAHNSQITPQLDAVVLQAMAKDRNERFQTADDFRDHLRAAANAVRHEQQSAPADPLSEFEALLRGDASTGAAPTEGAPVLGETAGVPAAPATEVMATGAMDNEVTPTEVLPSSNSALDALFAETTAAPAGVEYVTDEPVNQAPNFPNQPNVPAATNNPTEVISNPFESLGIDFNATSTNTTAIPLQTGATPRVRRSSGAPSPKLLWTVGSALGVVVVGLAIWFAMLGSISLTINPSGQGISVANVANQNYDAGYQTLIGQKLLVEKIYQTSDTVPADTIISTDPPAGTKVGTNTTITVYVSSGKGQVLMPDLTGLTEEAAGTAITNAKLVLGTKTVENSATVPNGQVISSDPAAGSKIAAGSTVNLVISNGQVNVPDVRNLDSVTAQARLRAPDIGLVVTVIGQTDPCTGTLGTIILDQSIMPGLAPQGSAITLTVACNP